MDCEASYKWVLVGIDNELNECKQPVCEGTKQQSINDDGMGGIDLPGLSNQSFCCWTRKDSKRVSVADNPMKSSTQCATLFRSLPFFCRSMQLLVPVLHRMNKFQLRPGHVLLRKYVCFLSHQTSRKES